MTTFPKMVTSTMGCRNFTRRNQVFALNRLPASELVVLASILIYHNSWYTVMDVASLRPVTAVVSCKGEAALVDS